MARDAKVWWRGFGRGLGACFVLFAATARSADGVIEINQACAVGPGCFVGDAPGFPVTIVNRGSYRLTSNLQVASANTTAVSVQSEFVTMDLGGFHVRGVTDCTPDPTICSPLGTGSGVAVDTSGRFGVQVRNGTVSRMGASGVVVGGEGVVEQIVAEENGGIGIVGGNPAVFLSPARVRNNVAHFNGSHGIQTGEGAVVTGNVATRNAADGINCDFSSTLTGNSASRNGEDGIDCGDGSVVAENTVTFNGDETLQFTDDGIECGAGCSVRVNAVRANSGSGLSLGIGSAYSHNVVTENQTAQVVGGTNRNDNFCSGPGTVSAFCP
jgi:hypothetical protein